MNAKRWIFFVSLIAIILVISRVFYGNIVEASRGDRCGCGVRRGDRCGCPCMLGRGRGRRAMKAAPLYIYNREQDVSPFWR